VDAVVTVSDAEIVAAMQLVMERMKVVVEPSGAAGLAAVLSPQFGRQLGGSCQRVGVILCGGNLDLGAKGFWKLWQAE
jgi:serine racemase